MIKKLINYVIQVDNKVYVETSFLRFLKLFLRGTKILSFPKIKIHLIFLKIGEYQWGRKPLSFSKFIRGERRLYDN